MQLKELIVKLQDEAVEQCIKDNRRLEKLLDEAIAQLEENRKTFEYQEQGYAVANNERIQIFTTKGVTHLYFEDWLHGHDVTITIDADGNTLVSDDWTGEPEWLACDLPSKLQQLSRWLESRYRHGKGWSFEQFVRDEEDQDVSR